ncbi:hypothetical protein H9W91_29945 [Streptomyces alfalfae]|nr:hypothetical protein [Streptomyces alfalfae]QUI34605.1 hypothetical protein H9W91_29945 [Streptomyces alfalfae]
MSATEIVVEDVLAELLDGDDVAALTELETDPSLMPTSVGSIIYTFMIHC